MKGLKFKHGISLLILFLVIGVSLFTSLPIGEVGADIKVIDKELYITHSYPTMVFGDDISYSSMYFTFKLNGDIEIIDDMGNKLQIPAYAPNPSITQGNNLIIQDYGALQIVYDFSRKDNQVKITYKGNYKGTINLPLIADTSKSLFSSASIKDNAYEVGIYNESGTLINGISYDWSDAKGIVSLNKDNKIEFTTDGAFNIDPSIVGACGTSGTNQLGRVSYRRVFYASGNHWAFYSDGTNQGYRSSLDGITWSNFSTIGTGLGTVNTQGITVCFDGVNFHYVRESPADSDLYYRMGQAETNGSITWLAAENKVKAGTLAVRSICVNSSGYPVIGYQDGTYEWVITSSTKNGTWTTAVDTQLSTTSYWGLLVSPLTSDKLYAMYFTNDNIYGRLWNGSAWEAQITITTRNPSAQIFASVASNGDSIYLTYLEGTTYDIRFIEYNGSSWGTDTLVLALAKDHCSPSIALKGTTGDLRIFWANAPDNNHIYYITRTSGTWDVGSTDWITDADTIPYIYSFSGADKIYNGITGVVWVSNASSPYYVKYDYLTDIFLTTTSGIGGNVTTPGENTYAYSINQSVNISATADACYHFVNWTGNTTEITDVNASATTINMTTSDKTATANFAINTSVITYVAGAGGTINGTSPQTINCGSYTTSVTATPNVCYHFVNWSDSNISATRSDIGTSTNQTFTANFAIDVETVTYSAGAGGSVNGSWPENVDCGDDSSWVLATADPCYYFVDWSDASTINPRQETNVTSNLSFTANFAIYEYDLTTTSSAGGDVTDPGESTYTYNCGDIVDLEATADACYHFVNWTGDIGDIDDINEPITTITMTANASITANFAIDVEVLTYNAGAGGSIVGDTPQNVNCGGDGTEVIATPDPCYHFINWSDAVGTASRTDLGVTSNLTVTANFAIDIEVLTYTAGANGTINGSSPQNINCGSNGSAVTAEADPCYHFVNWSDSSTDNPRTDINVVANISVTANFAGDNYDLTTTSTSGGNVSTPGEGTYNHACNDIVNLVATADPCYYFVNWSGDTGDIADVNDSTTTITMLANASITANFAITTYTLAVLADPVAGGAPTFDGSSPFNCSDVVVIHAGLNPCWVFTGWTPVAGINDSTLEDAEIIMSANTILTAHYSSDMVLTLSSSGGGDVTTPTEGMHHYNCSDVVPLIATPDAFYYFVDWTGDVGTVDDVNDPTTNVTMNGSYDIKANFAIVGGLYPPTNLSVTMTSGSCFNMTWTMGINASSTIFVISEDTPRDCSDTDFGNFSAGSYLLYNGSGTSLTFDYCGLDLNSYNYYITGWSSNGSGYSPVCASITIGGGDMVDALYTGLAAFIALGLSAIGFWQKKTWVFLLAGMAWVGFGIWELTSGASGTLYWYFGWLGLVAGLVMFLAPAWNWKKDKSKTFLDADEEYSRQIDRETGKTKKED